VLPDRNKQGQTRFSSYYEWISMEERSALESEIIRKCLSRSELQCSFLEYRGYKVIYRRYASLFFIAGTKPDGDDTENSENELGMLEFIHTLVETMDKWAGSICGTCPHLFRRAAFELVPLASWILRSLTFEVCAASELVFAHVQN
jgi:Clathrin adaptor complex small chain